MDLNDVLRLGFLTGSRYFNVAGADSDYDIIVMNDVPLPDMTEIDDIGSGDHIFGNTENIKGKIGNILVNFIIFNDIDLHNALIDTSKKVKELGCEFYTDKEVRHRVFEAVNATILDIRGLKLENSITSWDDDTFSF